MGNWGCAYRVAVWRFTNDSHKVGYDSRKLTGRFTQQGMIRAILWMFRARARIVLANHLFPAVWISSATPDLLLYSVELVLLNKHQISGGGAYLDCYPYYDN